MNTRQATRPATRSGCAETSRRAPPEFSYHSLSFDGVDQYVDCGTNSSLLLGRTMTVSGWAKIDSHTGENPIIGATKTSGMDALYYLGTRVKASDKVWTFWREDEDGTDYNADSAAVAATGEWTHVVGTDDGTNIKLYINGVLTDTTAASGLTVPDTLNSAYLGRAEEGWDAANSYLEGDIDEVAVWNAALDADAVTAVYNSGAPNNLNQDNGDYTNSGDLQGWWRMGEGNDPGYYLISDASGNGNDGTTQNEPAWSNDTPQRWPQNFSYYGIEFNGVDQYVATTADDTLATKSYSFWAKATGMSNPIFTHGEASGWGIGGALIFNFAGSVPILYMKTDYWVKWDDNAAQDDDAWHHHVFYVEHDDILNSKWYVDGVLQDIYLSNVSGGSADAYTTALQIGRSGTYEFDGELDEFAVFDGELTSAQVTALYNGGKPAAIAGAEHWWRMGEGNTVDGALVTDLAATDSNALYLPGVASNYASVPDAADLDGFGDFTFEAKGVTFADWTSPATDQGLMSKYKTSTNERAWRLSLRTDGKLHLVLSFDGSGSPAYLSTTTTGMPSDGATADIMVMRTGEDIRFYVNGVKIGDDVTVVTTALKNSTEPVVIGAGYNTTTNPMTGSIQRARVWNSAVANQTTPTETPVLDMDFTLADKGTSSFTATSGQTVTVNTTSIADPAVIRQATDGVNVNSPAWTKNTPS